MGLIKDSDFYYFSAENEYYLLDIQNSYWYQVDLDAIRTVKKAVRASSQEELFSALEKEVGASKAKELTDTFMSLLQGGAFSAQTKPLGTDGGKFNIQAITVHVANTCNLNCRYCYGAGGNYRMKDSLMTPEIGRKCVDFISERSIETEIPVSFFGGEPLLNFPVIKEIVGYAESTGKKFTFGITTNGTIYDEEIIQYLHDHRIGINLSLDGDPETHNFLRKTRDGKPSYERVKGLLNSLKAKNHPIPGVRLTYTHFNPRLTDLMAHLLEIGMAHVAMAPVTATTEDDWGLNSHDLNFIYGEIEELHRQYKEALLNNKRFNVDEITKSLKKTVFYHKHNFGCGVGRNFVAISTEGDIYPCHRFVGMKNFCVGHVSGTIDEERLTQVTTMTVDRRETCKTCWARFICGGGCLQETAFDDGTFGAPREINCNITKKHIQEGVKLYTFLLQNRQDILAKFSKTRGNNHFDDC